MTQNLREDTYTKLRKLSPWWPSYNENLANRKEFFLVWVNFLRTND